MPSFPRIDLSALPTFELPTFDLPKFDLPTFDLPEVELPTVEQLTDFARDAAYIGVGLAVLTAERLQALQQQILEVLKERLAAVRDAV